MTETQEQLLKKAKQNLAAARYLYEKQFYEITASRAYYAMLYAAEACLLSKGLKYHSHSGVVAAFGQHFSKTRILPTELHHYLVRAMHVRHLSDYDCSGSLSPADSLEKIGWAGRFVEAIEVYLKSL